MFDIGFSELLLFGVIALIVLGPEKLPQAARTAGQWYAKIRRTVSTLQSEIEAELDLAETRQQMQKELAKIRQTETDMRREMAEMRGNIKEFEYSQNQNLKATHDAVVDDKQGKIDKTESEQNSSQLTTPKEFEYSYEKYEKNDKSEVSDDSLKADANDTKDIVGQTAQIISTKPWENMWFRLGAYDKARRLPAPPYLPNYKADILLNSHVDSHSATQTAASEQETD